MATYILGYFDGKNGVYEYGHKPLTTVHNAVETARAIINLKHADVVDIYKYDSRIKRFNKHPTFNDIAEYGGIWMAVSSRPINCWNNITYTKYGYYLPTKTGRKFYEF